MTKVVTDDHVDRLLENSENDTIRSLLLEVKASRSSQDAAEPVAWEFEEYYLARGGEGAWHLRISHQKPIPSPMTRAIRPVFAHPPQLQDANPVAWRGRSGERPWELSQRDPRHYQVFDTVEPLYAHPPQPQKATAGSKVVKPTASSWDAHVLGLRLDQVQRTIDYFWPDRLVTPSPVLNEEILRLAEVGEYLLNDCSYSAGDGYEQPLEFSINWEWQQSEPNQHGRGALLAQAVAWHKEQAEEGAVTEAYGARNRLITPPPVPVGFEETAEAIWDTLMDAVTDGLPGQDASTAPVGEQGVIYGWHRHAVLAAMDELSDWLNRGTGLGDVENEVSFGESIGTLVSVVGRMLASLSSPDTEPSDDEIWAAHDKLWETRTAGQFAAVRDALIAALNSRKGGA